MHAGQCMYTVTSLWQTILLESGTGTRADRAMVIGSTAADGLLGLD